MLRNCSFITACALIVIIFAADIRAASPQRVEDPVVLRGQQLPQLLGLACNRVVAFRYQQGWHQVPVQIDERKWVDYGTVYNSNPVGWSTWAYADSTTYTGADTDPSFDSDDELVLMGGDTGDRAETAIIPPPGTVGNGVEIRVLDPLSSQEAYVYLFETGGDLSPDAGLDYVSYTFNLLSGSYIPTYKTLDGPNPENSEAVSSHYRTHFSDRWICDRLHVLASGATGVDILDRHKNMFAPGNCTRTENTFSNAEGAFFTNKDGPVRAIRSYLGANSGPLTQREHVFYRQRQDVTTFLRVHTIGGMMDLYDYSPAATGMTYFNNLNLGGVLIDGQPETPTAGPLDWEMATGLQGSMIIAHQIETDISPFPWTSYYSDDATPSVQQCTGDTYEYATSGMWINHSIPNTDPQAGAYKSLTSRRIIYYESPGQTVSIAQTRVAQAATPFSLQVQSYLTIPGDIDGDRDVDRDDVAQFLLCLTGPVLGPVESQCLPFDFDEDDDVDLADHGVIQRCLSGRNTPADPQCAGTTGP